MKLSKILLASSGAIVLSFFLRLPYKISLPKRLVLVKIYKDEHKSEEHKSEMPQTSWVFVEQSNGEHLEASKRVYLCDKMEELYNKISDPVLHNKLLCKSLYDVKILNKTNSTARYILRLEDSLLRFMKVNVERSCFEEMDIPETGKLHTSFRPCFIGKSNIANPAIGKSVANPAIGKSIENPAIGKSNAFIEVPSMKTRFKISDKVSWLFATMTVTYQIYPIFSERPKSCNFCGSICVSEQAEVSITPISAALLYLFQRSSSLPETLSLLESRA